MGVPQAGDWVFVATEALGSVECELIDELAGNRGYVLESYPEDGEAFVVLSPDEREGSYIPFDLLTVE